MVLFLLAQPVMMLSWLTCGQKQTTHKRGTATVWSLQAWAAGSVPPRSRGTADCLRLPFPAGPGVRLSYSSLPLFGLLWLLLGPSSSTSAKVFVLVSAFVCRQGAMYCCPVCAPTAQTKDDKSQLQAACSCTAT